MVWFFLIPSIPTVLGNFLLPLMIGARDVAFPRLNLLSWYIFVLGGIFTLYATISGGVDTRLDLLHSIQHRRIANGHVMAMAVGIFVVGFFLDLHRAQFHRHDPHDARAGDALVPAADVRVGRSTPRA